MRFIRDSFFSQIQQFAVFGLLYVSTVAASQLGSSIPIPHQLQRNLDQHIKQLDSPTSALLNPSEFMSLSYSIFQGSSRLKYLTKDDNAGRDLFEKYAHLSRTAVALIFLLRQDLDAAHEVVLGVTPYNVVGATYAATHPESRWMDEHPLSASDDYVHSLIHVQEGSLIGEGDHEGWENAKYWAAGGPKNLASPYNHAVFQALAIYAQRQSPDCLKHGLVVDALNSKICVEHSILTDGGMNRIVSVPAGCWDPFCFINLQRDFENLHTKLRDEIRDLIRYQYILLMRYLLRQHQGLPCTGRHLLEEGLTE